MVDYDETQAIGKRYRRQDEIGTPLCVTVDFDSLDDDAVTIRDRDTTEQVRVPIDAARDRGAPAASASDALRRARAAGATPKVVGGAAARDCATAHLAAHRDRPARCTIARPRPLELSRRRRLMPGDVQALEHVRQVVRDRCRGRRRRTVERRPVRDRSPPTRSRDAMRAYFSAFSTRLAATWASRSWSAVTISGPAMVARLQLTVAFGRIGLEALDRDRWPAAPRSTGSACSENVDGLQLGQVQQVGDQPFQPARLDLMIAGGDAAGSTAPSLIASA